MSFPKGAGPRFRLHPDRTGHGDGDHERFAHYVKKDKILTSALSGDPVTALCGKVWIPNRDPNKFPVCPECKAIFDGLKK